jgi:diguanylate cyclase (GGDEF)-like protein
MQTSFSFTGIGVIVSPAIQIGLLLFTILFYGYLLHKTRRWFVFVAFLISMFAMGLPLLSIQRQLLNLGAIADYTPRLLLMLEHVFASTMVLLFPVFLYLRSMEETDPASQLSGMDRLVLPAGIATGILLIAGGIFFPGQIALEAAAAPSLLMMLRGGVIIAGVLYYSGSLLLKAAGGRSGRDLFILGTTVLILLATALLQLADLRSGEVMGSRFMEIGLTALITNTAFILVREYMDRANQTRRVENELAYLESHDSLTKMKNRRSFYLALESICHGYRRKGDGDIMHAVIFVDLDYFTDINDSLGNDAGNQILIAVAQRFARIAEDSIQLFRIGGDEFALLMSELSSELDVALFSEKLLQSLSDPFDYRRHSAYISASIGISIVPRDGVAIEEVTSHADQALASAKLDRNTYRFFTPAMHERSTSKIQMINYLRQAVDRQELSLHFQPQLDMRGTLVGAEALLRWNHALLGSVSPRDFIPVAEESGLIIPIGAWVIEQACQTLAHWRELSLDIPVSINLSPRQLRDVKLQRTIIQNLRNYDLDPRYLHLEITENSLIEDQEGLIEKLRRLSDIGLNFSIDDFGTGYSSLSYLKNLPIAAVKIDRSFVIDLPRDDQNGALVQAIISMVQRLGYQVVAEGVDNAEQLNFLRESNCDIIQGFYHSEPLNDQGFLDYAQALSTN